jgi:type I restriction enzyme S subunit
VTAVRLKFLCSRISRGGTPRYAEEESAGTALVIGQSCQRPDGSFDPARARWHEGPLPAKGLLRTGDVLLNSTGTGTLGRSALVRSVGPVTAFADSHVTVLRCDARRLDSGFLAYSVGLRSFQRLAEHALSVGATKQKELNVEAVRNHALLAPDLARQRKVVNFLDRESERITAALTSAASVAASVSTGLAEERERIYIDNVRPLRLTGVLSQTPRYGVLVPALQDEGVPFIRVGNLLHLDDGLEKVTARIPRDQAAEYRRTTVRAGDVLVSVVGSIDKSAIVPADLAGANVARAVALLRPGTITPYLLWGWTRTRAYRDQAQIATSADTAQPTLNMGDLARFRINVPADPEAAQERLERIETLVCQTHTTSRGVESALREYRDCLIHEAVTGKLDVSRASEQQMDERLNAAAEDVPDEAAV